MERDFDIPQGHYQIGRDIPGGVYLIGALNKFTIIWAFVLRVFII